MKRDVIFEKWAMPQLRKLQKLYLLEHFEPLRIETTDKENVVAECAISYPYQSITIRYSSELTKDFRDKKFSSIMATLAHEMAHPLTDPLYWKATGRYSSKEEINDEREKLTDHIANILIKNKLI